MRMTVIGCGYLGAVHAACMAALGHDVVGIDIDHDKVHSLASGRSPFHEPGLDEILAQTTAAGRLRFTAEPTAADLRGRGLHFITVGTPQAAGEGSADLSHLMRAVSMLVRLLDP
ncbi:MAG: UDP-glucose 6-dehydrogenase, partial [Schaalia georgiae]|nr:UDP-glucose 6-dehydrogenase [Schaalia georgiae]